MHTNFRTTAVAAFLLLMATHPAQAGEPYINATVGGVLAPGIYGRVEFGNAPPPQIYNPQPVIVARPPGAVVQQVAPVYLYVPPGHQKNWKKHCQRYNACGQPVYFVKEPKHEHDEAHNDDRGKGHGKGHGKNGKD